jgi:hypothetical protein
MTKPIYSLSRVCIPFSFWSNQSTSVPLTPHHSLPPTFATDYSILSADKHQWQQIFLSLRIGNAGVLINLIALKGSQN